MSPVFGIVGRADIGIHCFLSCDCNLFDDMNVRLRSLLCLSVSLGQKVYDQGEEDDDDD